MCFFGARTLVTKNSWKISMSWLSIGQKGKTTVSKCHIFFKVGLILGISISIFDLLMEWCWSMIANVSNWLILWPLFQSCLFWRLNFCSRIRFSDTLAGYNSRCGYFKWRNGVGHFTFSQVLVWRVKAQTALLRRKETSLTCTGSQSLPPNDRGRCCIPSWMIPSHRHRVPLCNMTEMIQALKWSTALWCSQWLVPRYRH